MLYTFPMQVFTCACSAASIMDVECVLAVWLELHRYQATKMLPFSVNGPVVLVAGKVRISSSDQLDSSGF